MYVCVHVCVHVCACVCVWGGGGGAGGTGKILPSPSFLFIHLLPLPHSLTCASRSGELQQNALHLATHANNLPLLEEMLRFAGDVEVRNASYLQPLALTTPSNHCHCVWRCRAVMYVTAVEQMLRQLGEREGERSTRGTSSLTHLCTLRAPPGTCEQ